MATTTFSGPVRSIGGFQTVTVNATTGAVSTSATFGSTTAITALTTSTVAASSTVTARNGVALTAGGAPAFIATSAANSMGIYFGSGAPTVTAAKGSLYLRSDGTGAADRAYLNTDGATAWTAITTVA